MSMLPTSGCCTECDCSCTEKDYVQVEGPQGAAGAAGAAGADGADGESPWTETSAQFTVPAVSATVGIFVDSTAWMFVGQILQIEGAGGYEVTGIPSGVSVTVENLGWAINAAPGAVIAVDAMIVPSGPEGAAGSGYAPTDATYWCRTANGTLTNESNMSALASGYVKVTTGTGVPSSVAKVPTSDVDGDALTAGFVTVNGAGTIGSQVKVLTAEIDGDALTAGFVTVDGAGAIGSQAKVLTAEIDGDALAAGYLTVDAAGVVGSSAGLSASAARLYYSVAAGTDGQSIVGAATTTVELNSETDPDAIVTLAANQFSLAAGAYLITVELPIYQRDNSDHPFRLELYDVTGAAVLARKSVMIESDTEYAVGWLTHPVTIVGANTFSVRLVSDASANATLGRAVNLGGIVEVFTQVQILKM